MFEVCEVKSREETQSLAASFDVQITALDRVFALYEDGARGVAVIGLNGGAAEIKAVTDCGNAAYKDALTRSVLAVLQNMNPLQVIVKGSVSYFAAFGFAESDGYMRISNKQIKFACNR